MEALTNEQFKTLNDVSQQRDPDVKLGNILAAIIAYGLAIEIPELPEIPALIEEGTPVNAVAAEEELTIDGPVVHGETVTIGEDVYEFVADVAQSVSAEGNIPVDIMLLTTPAVGELTMDTQPTAGDTVLIGEKTFIFVPVGTDNADGEVSVGADLAGAQAALVAAINGTDDHNIAHPLVSASDFALDVLTITALIGGVAGNLIATESSFTALTNAFGDTVLDTGADCAAVDAVTALIAEITASDTQGVAAAADGGNANLVLLSAEVAGAAGNDIGVSTDMANGAFTVEAVTLSGGVDGTVAEGITLLIDETWLYVCLFGNTVSQTNWRRIALGAAF